MGVAESKPDTLKQEIGRNLAKDCKIVVIGLKSGEDCLTELRWLPLEAHILGTGSTYEELESEKVPYRDANVLLVTSGNSAILSEIVKRMPNLSWIHSIFAGLDHIMYPDLSNDEHIVMTNAKGLFSSSLAEYVIAACSYFAKDFPRLMRQKNEKKWEKYCVAELRGKTMGIIGYGDIGRACATLAKAYGMKVIALRRRPQLSSKDSLIDNMYGPDKICDVFADSDYLVVAAPLTKETEGLIGTRELNAAKSGQVLINIGRGKIIDEEALAIALGDTGKLLGAALDVFCTEPLPESSPFWVLPNVLLSPHNADMTTDFKHRSVKFFTENCKRFISGDDLECVVDKKAGY